MTRAALAEGVGRPVTAGRSGGCISYSALAELARSAVDLAAVTDYVLAPAKVSSASHLSS